MSFSKNKASWQMAVSKKMTPNQLLDQLQLEPLSVTDPILNPEFPFKVTSAMVDQMHIQDDHDPVLLQFLPIAAELITTPGYTADPLKEQEYNPLPGLIKKYHGRVLITLTGSCAVNCRYCFRRHFPYEQNNPGKEGWKDIYQFLEQDSSITEVILSGGDPLMVPDGTLALFIQGLEKINHLKRLRFHTRIPIVLPERITAQFIELLSKTSLATSIVIHCNHPQEIGDKAAIALDKIHRAGIILLNQSVLLKGINNDAQILAELSETLFAHHVLPYYLHLLDKVEGAAHFATTEIEAIQIHRKLTEILPGYLVPKLVVERAGEASKTGL